MPETSPCDGGQTSDQRQCARRSNLDLVYHASSGESLLLITTSTAKIGSQTGHRTLVLADH